MANVCDPNHVIGYKLCPRVGDATTASRARSCRDRSLRQREKHVIDIFSTPSAPAVARRRLNIYPTSAPASAIITPLDGNQATCV